MKSQDVVILAAAALVGWYLIKSAKGATVKRAGDGAWHTYENGVTIDPAGNYYRDGVLIWSPYAVPQQ